MCKYLASMKRGSFEISLFWFLYMAGLGVIFPYLSLYLQQHAGLSGTQLGLALAMHPLMGILASPFWGQWADRTGRRKGALGLLAGGGAIGYAIVPFADGLFPLLLSLAFLSVFTAPAMAVASSLSFAVLGRGRSTDFGKVRVWGTVGYLLTILFFPYLAETIGERASGTGAASGLQLIFPVASVMSLLSALVLLRVPSGSALSLRARKEDLLLLLRQRSYIRLLTLAFFAFGLLAGPIVLFPIFVTSRGGTLETISQLWIPMLLLEIPLILFAGSGLRRLGARGLISAGIACDGARWLISALAPTLVWVFGVQLLHGVVVVGLIIGMQLYVEGEVPEALRVTGQTLLGTVMSIGSVLSHLWAGFALEHFGPSVPYFVSGMASIALGVFAWFFLRPRLPTSRFTVSPPVKNG